MFTKSDLHSALRQGDVSKVNFLVVMLIPGEGYKIVLLPKGETKFNPDKNEGGVVVCFGSFHSHEGFLGANANLDNEVVDGFYQRLIYMYLSYRVTGIPCFDEDYSSDLLKFLEDDLVKLNGEIEEGISCLVKEMNS